MITEEEIKALIVYRVFSIVDNCRNPNQTIGQIEALISVLGDGTKPTTIQNPIDVFKAANIPFTETETQWDIPDQWLIDRGFSIDKDGTVCHPRFKNW